MKKSITPLLFLILSITGGFSQNCTTLSQQFGLAIPDNNEAGTNAPLNVNLQGQLGINWVLDSVRLQVTHTYLGDIMAVLITPAGDTAILFDRPGVPNSTFGCANDNVDAVFSDVYTLLAEGVCYPNPLALSGGIKPITPLQNLHNGSPTQGNWIVNVSDRAGGDLGIIDNVWLYFTPIWYTDADNDGFGAGVGQKVCTQPTGSVFNNLDCNDSNPTVYPGALEICGNKIDEDCSGFDTDYIYQPTLSAFSGNGFCPGDSALLLIAPYVSGDTVFWFFNGSPLPTNTGNFLFAPQEGVYSAAVLQENGCYYLPESVEVQAYSIPQPQISLSSDGLFAGNYDLYSWFLNGEPIAGGNDATLIPQSNGTYSVQVTDENGCTGISDPFTFNSLGTHDEQIPGKVYCFPNPTDGLVSIEFSVVTELPLRLLDVAGKELLRREFFGTTLSLNLSEYPAGIYLIVCGPERVRLIKQ